MFLLSILTILIISFLLAVLSFKKENAKREISKVKKHLSKGRVIFQKKY